MKHELKTFHVPDLEEPEFSYEIAVLKKSEPSTFAKGEPIMRNTYVVNAGEPTNIFVIYPHDVAVYEEILAWIKSQETQLDSDAPAGA